jgi:hypothetical protein
MSDWQSYIIFAIVILLLFWILTRGRRKGSNRLQIIIGLISNVNDNLKIMEMHVTNKESTRKFKTRDWNYSLDKLDFIDQPVVEELKQSYTTMNDFNEKIELASRNKNTASLMELPVENLREPLIKGRQGLSQWLRDNLQKEMGSRRGGLFGF